MATVRKLKLEVERVKLAEGVASYAQSPVRLSADVAPLLHSLLDKEAHEVFLLVALDAKNRILGYSEVARGGSSSCAITPAEVYKAAILSGAVGVVLSNNHPSGDPSPSADDVSMTHRLSEGAKLLGIRVVDHIIVGDPGHFSFLDAGLLNKAG